MGFVYMYWTVARFCGGFFLSSWGVHAAALTASDRSVLSPR